MPMAPAIACACGGRRRSGEACDRCGKGGKANRREQQRQHDAARGTRTQRGYDNRWLAFAKQYLNENPLCVDCESEGIVGGATEVHHKRKLRDNPELKYEPSNLAGLCKRHHSERTARGE